MLICNWGERERDFLSAEHASMYAGHINMCQRYIDDIFIVWDGPEDELGEALKLMNKNNFNLFFTMAHDPKEVHFLDICICKYSDGKISSKLFRKETAGNMLLHADSFYPEALKSLLVKELHH